MDIELINKISSDILLLDSKIDRLKREIKAITETDCEYYITVEYDRKSRNGPSFYSLSQEYAINTLNLHLAELLQKLEEKHNEINSIK